MRKMDTRRRRARGFTLIEVLGATVVLVTGLLAAFYLFAQGTAMNTGSKAEMAAYLAAQKEIETVRNTSFHTVATRTFTPANTNLASPSGKVTVSTHNGVPELKNVAVVVSWKERGNEDRSVVVATVVGQEGIVVQ